MTYSMRNALPGDAAFVVGLLNMPHVAAHLHAPSEDQFLRALSRVNGENLIIERDGEPFGNLVLEREPEWFLTIRALAVRTPRCGAGRFAMEYAIRRGFRELGVHRIYLEVLEDNVSARQLYESAGMRAEGVFRDGYREESGVFRNLVPYGMVAGE
jgi:ribosomal protein S18 acetylase RimI-like enzyme